MKTVSSAVAISLLAAAPGIASETPNVIRGGAKPPTMQMAPS